MSRIEGSMDSNLGPRRRDIPSSPRAAPTLALISAHEALLYLRVDPVQPLLSALRLFLIGCDLGFELRDPILGCAQLMRKSLGCFDRVSAVILRDSSCFI
jgi:hypothetical protein